MHNGWIEDLSESVVAFEKIKLTIIPKLISGEIIRVESQNNNLNFLLDVDAGIDYIRKNEHGIQGIASRIQFEYDCNTFTIRTERESGNKTELEKRLYAIEHGYLYPEFTLHAYFETQHPLKLHSIAAIRTIDLFNYYKTNKGDFFQQKSNAVFIAVHWNNFLREKIPIKIYKEYEKDNYSEIPF